MAKKYLSLAEECRAYDTMWEWVDSKGNKINTSTSPNPKATPKTTAAFGSFAPQYQKLIAYYQKHLTTNVIHCGIQALTLEFPNTGNQLKLHIIQDPQNNCLVCTLFDGSNNDKVLAKSTYLKTWDEVLDWLINYGGVRAADRSLCEAKLDGTPTKKESKPKVEDYFTEITASKAAVVDFIKNKLAPKIKIKKGKYADISTSYTQVVAKETSGNHNEIGTNPEYNYKAFTTKTAQFGIYAKDILHFAKTGEFVQTVPLTESCKFDFTKEDLDAALDKLTEEDDQGLEIGDNFEDSDVMVVAGEPYGGTKWYVDKWADNLYIITSELWGQDGGGPEEGVYEELDSIDEVWDYLSRLDQLSGVPALGPRKPEPPKPDPKYCFNKRFFKVVEYFRHNLQPNVKLISVDELTHSSLKFKEHYNNGDLVKYAITIFAGEPINWTLTVTKNEQSPDQYQGKDWENLLKILRAFFPLPAKTTQEYAGILTEWKDKNNQQITLTGHPSGWNLYSINSPEVCEGCGQIVEFNPNLKNNQIFVEPYILKNGHKLCSECMVEWIKLPKGFIDKMSITSQYEIMGGDIDEFIENINISQKDVDDMIMEWNKRKKQGQITLQPQEIGNLETHFIDAVQKLGLKADPTDFI